MKLKRFAEAIVILAAVLVAVAVVFVAGVARAHQVGPNVYTTEGHGFDDDYGYPGYDLKWYAGYGDALIMEEPNAEEEPSTPRRLITEPYPPAIVTLSDDGVLVVHDPEYRLSLIREWGKSGEVCEVFGHRWKMEPVGKYLPKPYHGPYRSCEICGRWERQQWVLTDGTAYTIDASGSVEEEL